MKKNEIRVGGLYLAKVSNRIVTVRVDAIREVRGRVNTWANTGYNVKTVYDVTNLSTGRKTTFRSAAKFREEAQPTSVPKGTLKAVEREFLKATGQQFVETGDGGPNPTLAPSAGPTPSTAAGAKISSPATDQDTPSTDGQHKPGDVGFDPSVMKNVCRCRRCRDIRSGVKTEEQIERKAVEYVNEVEKANLAKDPHCYDNTASGVVDNTAGTVSAFDAEARGEGEQRPDPTPRPASPVRSAATTAAGTPAPVSSGLAAKLAADKAKRSVSLAPHLVVEARAGTGKTTTLVCGLQVVRGLPPTDAKGRVLTPSPQQKAVWDAMAEGPAPTTVGFVAFNSAIAEELKSRVPPGCDARTMHSLGFRTVLNAYPQLRGRKLNDWRTQDVLAEILQRNPRELSKDPKWVGVCRAVAELVSLCKMNLTGNEDIRREYGHGAAITGIDDEDLSRLAAHYDVELNGDRDRVFELVPQVLERCKDPEAGGMIGFDDMIWLPVVLGLPVQKYDLLLVDEAQDLNRCQQALAKMAGRRLVLCGDPKQAIYGFAGADAESMPRMMWELGACKDNNGHDWDASHGSSSCGKCGRFRGDTDGRGCKVLPLTVTRRCGKAIVKEANRYVPDFEAHESNPEGEVRQAVYSHRKVNGERTEQPWEKTYCAEVRSGDFVLCRVNAPLVSQCFRFLKRGIKATIRGRDIGKGLTSLVEKMRASSVPDLLVKLEDWAEKEREKEAKKKYASEARMIAIQDKHDCLACFTDGAASVEEVKARIDRVFTDDKAGEGIRLSSIHKAKGLEADRVFFLRPEEGPCPHPMAKSHWQREQEQNLCYVAVTRAIHVLVYVS